MFCSKSNELPHTLSFSLTCLYLGQHLGCIGACPAQVRQESRLILRLRRAYAPPSGLVLIRVVHIVRARVPLILKNTRIVITRTLLLLLLLRIPTGNLTTGFEQIGRF